MLGFDNLPLSVKGRPDNYALLLCDVVLVQEAKTELVTALKEKKFTYDLESEDTRKEKSVAMLPSSSVLEEIAANTTRQPRAAAGEKESKIEEDRRLHQRQLAEKQLQERVKKYQQTESEGPANTSAPAKTTDMVTYQNTSKFPAAAPLHRIYVDAESEALILPIYGNMVAFHINTVKSVTKDNEYLRVAFLYPNTPSALALLNHRAAKDAEKCTFIRELSFCVPDQVVLTNYLHQIKQLMKVVKQKEALKDQMRSIKQQDSLKLSRDGSIPRLTSVLPRPSPAGKTSGALEVHTNGFRFLGAKMKQPLDILFSNVRYAFFQPCTAKEMIVLVHFNLRHEIMVGKKKTSDIQFCLEATEMSQSLTKRSQYGDPDEFEEERRERATRKKYNEAFRKFANQVRDQVNNQFDFDIPYAELGFYGVPNKSRVFLQPTSDCLVQLVEPPFFVLPLSEIEICCLERVSVSNVTFNLDGK